jgi:hypothetical protein
MKELREDKLLEVDDNEIRSRKRLTRKSKTN